MKRVNDTTNRPLKGLTIQLTVVPCGAPVNADAQNSRKPRVSILSPLQTQPVRFCSPGPKARVGGKGRDRLP